MAGISWIHRRTYLWVFFFSFSILGSVAHMIDVESCKNMRQYDSSGQLISYDKKLNVVSSALQETAYMAKIADARIRDVEEDIAEDFHRLRVKFIVAALQDMIQTRPRTHLIDQPSWHDVAGLSTKMDEGR